jgi:glycosyltransferase involved in cell wall biosynthesis
MLIEVGARPEDLILVPNGVRPEAFSEASPEEVPEPIRSKLDGAIVAGYFGTFAPYHDLQSLLDGFAIARIRVPELKLLFIGAGFRDVTTVEAVDRSGLSDAVVFTGQVDHDEVPAHAALCDILVNPLRKLYAAGFHGVPIKLLEYMAAGRPIISTDMPNLRDVLGDSATMVPEGSVEGWAEALTGLATDADLRERLGRAGPERLVEQGYTWQENARIVHSFCSRILETEEEGG